LHPTAIPLGTIAVLEGSFDEGGNFIRIPILDFTEMKDVLENWSLTISRSQTG